MTCAVCTSTRGPFTREPLGRNDALVNVCAECSAPPVARELAPAYELPDPDDSRAYVEQWVTEYTERGQVTGYKSPRKNIAAMKDRSPGFIVEAVPVRKRDSREAARQAFAGKPWASRVRHLGTTTTHHIYERPDMDTLGKSSTSDPLAAIEQFRRAAKP